MWMPARHMRADELVQEFEARRARMTALRQKDSRLAIAEPRAMEPGEVSLPVV